MVELLIFNGQNLYFFLFSAVCSTYRYLSNQLFKARAGSGSATLISAMNPLTVPYLKDNPRNQRPHLFRTDIFISHFRLLESAKKQSYFSVYHHPRTKYTYIRKKFKNLITLGKSFYKFKNLQKLTHSQNLQLFATFLLLIETTT